MAGTKGKSGGPRKNAGGARPGAGRPPKPKPEPVRMPDSDMLTLLQNVALGYTEATSIQVRAAIAAVQYTHVKKADGGKKDGQADKAKAAAAGKYAARSGPRLVSSK